MKINVFFNMLHSIAILLQKVSFYTYVSEIQLILNFRAKNLL